MSDRPAVPERPSVGATQTPARHGHAPHDPTPGSSPPRRGPSQGVGGGERRCVTVDGAGPTRAARRWPPKRCRIIGIGDPNAIPVGRTPTTRAAHATAGLAPADGTGRWPPGTDARSDRAPVEGPRSPPCEVRSFGVEYLVRAARVTDIDRLVALSDATIDADRGAGPLGAADLLRQLVYLPQASIFVAESQRVRRRWGRPGPSSVGRRRWLRRHHRSPGRRPRPRRGPGDRCAPRGARPLGQQQGLHRHRGGPARTDPTAGARWAAQGFTGAGPRIQRIVAAAGSAARRT